MRTKAPRFVIKMGRQYYNHKLYKWFNTIAKAEDFSLAEARIYVRDWKKYKAIAILSN